MDEGSEVPDSQACHEPTEQRAAMAASAIVRPLAFRKAASCSGKFVFKSERMSGMYSAVNASQAFCFRTELDWHTEGVRVAKFLESKIGKTRGEIAEFARRVNVTRGQITNVLAGRRLPVPSILRGWAQHIPCTDAERAMFLEMALEDHLEQTEVEVQTLVKNQRLELASLREKVAHLEQQVINLGAELTRISSKRSKVIRDR